MIDIFSANTFGFFSAIAAIYGVAGGLFLALSQRRLRNRKKFFHVLHKGLELGTITNTNDINNLMEGVYGSRSNNQGQDYPGMVFLLRRALVELYESGDEKAVEHKEFLSKIIAECETNKPYSDLPTEEKNILIDAEAHLRSDDKEHVHRKLVELASKIKAKIEIIDKLDKGRKLSNFLAIVGLILTIVFGINSLK